MGAAATVPCRWLQPACQSGRAPARAVRAAAGTVLPPATLGKARLLYATAGAPAHTYPGHPECAERVPAIIERLEAEGLTAAARPGQVCDGGGGLPAACCLLHSSASCAAVLVSSRMPALLLSESLMLALSLCRAEAQHSSPFDSASSASRFRCS